MKYLRVDVSAQPVVTVGTLPHGQKLGTGSFKGNGSHTV